LEKPEEPSLTIRADISWKSGFMGIKNKGMVLLKPVLQKPESL
jgi:hypothetical protein